jgi:hypothetical protein
MLHTGVEIHIFCFQSDVSELIFQTISGGGQYFEIISKHKMSAFSEMPLINNSQSTFQTGSRSELPEIKSVLMNR